MSASTGLEMMLQEVTALKAKHEKQMEQIERLKKSEKMSERAFSTLFKRVSALEETTGVGEEKSDVELKRVIKGVVRGILDERKKEDVRSITYEHSEEFAWLRGVSKECLRVLEKSDRKLRSLRAHLEVEFKGQMAKTSVSVVETLRGLEADNAKMRETLGKLKEGFERDFEGLRKKSSRKIEERVSRLEKRSDEMEQLRDKTSQWLGMMIKSDRVVHDIKTEVDNQVKGLEVENQKLNEMIKDVTLDLKKAKNYSEESIDHLKTGIVQSNLQMDSFNICQKNIHFQPDFVWKIKGIKELVKQETFEVKSEVFTWNGYPVKAQAQLELKHDDQVYVSLNMKEHNVGKAIDIKLIPAVYYLLRDQSNNEQTKHRTRSTSYLFTSKFHSSLKFEKLIAHKLCLIDELYNVGDCVVIEIYLQPPSMANTVHSRDGLLSWSIDNYRKKKQMEKEELIGGQVSPYFYTGPRGYRVRAYMRLIGHKKHKGLCVVIDFLCGEFDAELSMNFPHQTTVTLLNRKYPERSIVKRVDKNIEEKKEYFIDVCGDEEVEDLLENDTLFCNVIVKSIE